MLFGAWTLDTVKQHIRAVHDQRTTDRPQRSVGPTNPGSAGSTSLTLSTSLPTADEQPHDPSTDEWVASMNHCTTPDCPNPVSRAGHQLCYSCWKKAQTQTSRSSPATARHKASDLGKHFNISSQRMNLTLAELGWIEKAVKGWVPTPQGIELGANRGDFRGRPYVT